jgi:hypothetical protein
MAHPGSVPALVPLQEPTISNACEVAALAAVLERKGILTREEVLEEIARQKRSHPQWPVTFPSRWMDSRPGSSAAWPRRSNPARCRRIC